MSISSDLLNLADLQKASDLERFFQTGKGGYGADDKFLGITVPNQRIIAKKYFKEATISEVQGLMESPLHEFRLTALIILTYKFEWLKSHPEIVSGSKQTKLEINLFQSTEQIYDFYLKNTKYINNWDLVDVSCHIIVGKFLLDKPRDILYKLAQSNNLWEQRIAMVSTYAFIKYNQLEDTFKLAKIFLTHQHHLMHKATGWMLREAGKKDVQKLFEFLDKYATKMPRTMLRYSIEKFDVKTRKYYLNLK